MHLIGIELLRAFTETCALVLLHEQFEAFDALFGRSQFTLDMKARRAFIVCATTLGFNHRFLRAEERGGTSASYHPKAPRETGCRV
ncbi:hypothetical protein [Bradyrhizobium diazoefficiens]|uniref:hypothetical protein n=1 Tax=Bradyrhizobium diazoefficiens TaxID=1355477 RepID=UPI00272B5E32|nr:hypothetical protein [Bradyrhizobium diazoefficiens]WLA69694.1 hypothetical protein QNN01_42595 [Bradyrhizobium diazoefficiens]WLA69695.1 hypothetical protein QNN01_42800 [Bradyrhizobium diazoefficiens]